MAFFTSPQFRLLTLLALLTAVAILFSVLRATPVDEVALRLATGALVGIWCGLCWIALAVALDPRWRQGWLAPRRMLHRVLTGLVCGSLLIAVLGWDHDSSQVFIAIGVLFATGLVHELQRAGRLRSSAPLRR